MIGEETVQPGRDHVEHRWVIGSAVLLAGLGLITAGQWELGRTLVSTGSLLAVVGMALGAVAVWLVSPRPDTETSALPPHLATWEKGFLAAAILAAGVLRFVALDRWPPGGFFDEAQNVLVAGEILKGHFVVYIAGATQMPALFFYLLAGVVKLLGQSFEAGRCLSALLGTLTVPAFYMLARRLFPGAPAVAATILLAGSRWHLNFSRIGFTGILCPLIEIVSLLALLRALDRGRRRDYILLGVAVAAGLQTYYAFNLFPAVLAVTAAVFLSRSALARPRPNLRVVARGIVWAALTAAILLAPLAAYAFKHPEEFFRRTGTVALWSPQHHLHFPDALWTNLRAHLLMFNVLGDGNPRHNLTGSPLLTAIEGVLLVFGLGCAFGRGTRWPEALLLSWVAVMMLPGILTIEAPQAYRTIGAVPAVFLLIALALQVISRSAAHVGRKPRTGPLLALAFTALAFAAAAENVVTYFVLQVRDRGAWMAFEADYQEVARIFRDAANGFRVWVDPIYYDYPTVRIPLGGQFRYNRFLLSDHLPVPRVPGPGQPPGDLYVLDGYQMDLVPLFRRAFPQASFRLHIDPFGRVMLVSIAVPWPAGARRPDSALANRGLLGAFYSNDSWSGKPVLFRHDPAVSFHFHWDRDGLPGHFTADWTARLHVEQGGEYEFGLISSDPGYLLIDGAVVVAQGHREDTDVLRGKIRLKPGDHLLVVRYQRGSFASALRCWWQPPGSRRLSVIPLDNLTPLTKQEYETTRVTLPIPVHTTGD